MTAINQVHYTYFLNPQPISTVGFTNVLRLGIGWRIQHYAIPIFITLATLAIGLAFSSLRKNLKNKCMQAWNKNLFSRQLIKKSVSQPSQSIALITPHQENSFKERAQKELNQLSQRHIQKHASFHSCTTYNLSTLREDSENDKGIYSCISPDCERGNLLLPFLSDSKVFFAPDQYYIDGRTEDFFIFDKTGLTNLNNLLKNAFAIGKEFVVVRLYDKRHSVAAAFQADGQFKIIDSMLNTTINLTHLTQELNKAQIKNAENLPILFKGDYINTHLQKGGNECGRFATLYCFQMAKKRSFNGFKEVNGAFAAGHLKKFEDVHSIEHVTLFEDASKIPVKNYKSFMKSWAYRTCNMQVDRWEDLSLIDLKTHPTSRSVFHLCDGQFIKSYIDDPHTPLKLKDDSSPLPMALDANWSQLKLETLIPEGDNKVIIVVDPQKEPLIFQLSANQDMNI